MRLPGASRFPSSATACFRGRFQCRTGEPNEASGSLGLPSFLTNRTPVERGYLAVTDKKRGWVGFRFRIRKRGPIRGTEKVSRLSRPRA